MQARSSPGLESPDGMALSIVGLGLGLDLGRRNPQMAGRRLGKLNLTPEERRSLRDLTDSAVAAVSVSRRVPSILPSRSWASLNRPPSTRSSVIRSQRIERYSILCTA